MSSIGSITRLLNCLQQGERDSAQRWHSPNGDRQGTRPGEPS
jgi:hypothetical protein